jgi:pyruvate formate lyase activating enzyme
MIANDDGVTTQGLILNLQRLSTEDGSGIRTTVFFKGCPMHCAWCHNPESISPKPQVHWIKVRCIGCKTCLETCKLKAVDVRDDEIIINRSVCNGCGDCAAACPGNAMELLGDRFDVAELIKELVKDRTYFEKSNGGVTLSGGEPTLQTEFALELLKSLNGMRVHTALDTCGICSKEKLQTLLPYVDLVLYDLKEADDQRHRQFTGMGNRLVFENLLITANYIRQHKGHPNLWIRTPLIPGSTANEMNITALGKFLGENLKDVVDRWELCAFNNLCRDKYRRLGLTWEYDQIPLISREELKTWERIAKESGFTPEKVSATGATAVEM